MAPHPWGSCWPGGSEERPSKPLCSGMQGQSDMAGALWVGRFLLSAPWRSPQPPPPRPNPQAPGASCCPWGPFLDLGGGWFSATLPLQSPPH